MFGSQTAGPNLNPDYDQVPTKDVEEGRKASVDKGKKIKNILHHFKPLIFLFLLIVYSLIGGWLFYLIENETALQMFELDIIHNTKLKQQTAMYIYSLLDIESFAFDNNNTDLSNNFSCIFNNSSTLNTTSLLPYDQLMEILETFSEKIIRKDARDIGDWSFLGSMFYAGTIYTTIGYGNVVPHTVASRILTIFYALFGIPLTLFTLAQLGKMFCNGLLHLYLYVSYVWFRTGADKERKDVVGEFPLSISFAITIGWMCLCSGIFCAWEPWNFFTSFYFFFQSLTTIGLGDVTPEYTKHMLSSFLLIIIGMSLVSMCLNLVQLKLEKFMNKMIEKIRNHYLQMELAEGTMSTDPDAAANQISKIASAQSAFLSAVMTDIAKERLVDEWQRRAALCNVGVQATVKMKEVGIGYHPEVEDSGTQYLPPILPDAGGTGGVGGRKNQSRSNHNLVSGSPSKSFEAPLKESRVRTSSTVASDEFRMKLKELGFVLDQCNSLVRKH